MHMSTYVIPEVPDEDRQQDSEDDNYANPSHVTPRGRDSDPWLPAINVNRLSGEELEISIEEDDDL